MVTHSARNVVTIAFLLALSAIAPGAFAQAPTLDGKVFVADAGPKGKDADEKGDVITFKDGTFHSSICDQYGYSKAPYKATAQGDAIAFETETNSAKDGRLVWKGTVKGDTIEGTFIHHRKPGFFNSKPEPVEHWFKGKVKG